MPMKKIAKSRGEVLTLASDFILESPGNLFKVVQAF